MSIHSAVKAQVAAILAADRPDQEALDDALRLLAKYRHTLLTNTIVARYGTTVLNGPFAGMRFVERASHGSHASKLLGCYEHELHPVIMSLPGRRYDAILNVGCAEGYYAVGLKRLMPGVEVHAYDTDPNGQATVREVAARNNVELVIGGEVRGADFEAFRGRKVLVICDIEGAEVDLMDPAAFPALAGMDILMECHPTRAGHAAEIVPSRFSGSHRVQAIPHRLSAAPLPELFDGLGELDRLLAIWEWRAAPTPWFFMTALRRGAESA